MPFRKTRTPDPIDQPTDVDVIHVDPADADAVRDQAEQARTEAHRARTEADTLLQTARAQAARLVAEAEQRARELTTRAHAADRLAAGLDERAQYLTHADALRAQAETAEQRALELADESDDQGTQSGALTDRLDQLAEQADDTTSALTRARETGDVPAVTQLRAQLAAVHEVAAVLTGQRDALQARLQAIGGPDDRGELAAALATAQTARTELRRVHNILDPERPEAVLDDLRVTCEVQLADLLTETGPVQRTVIDLRPAPTTEESPMATGIRKASTKAKATGSLVAAYDANGTLIGVVDPEKITPIADADPITKQAAALAVFGQIRKRTAA